MPNKNIRQHGVALDIALFACQSDTEMVSEFRRYVLRQFGVHIGRIDAFTQYPGDEYDFCLLYKNTRCYVLSESLNKAFLRVFAGLVNGLIVRLKGEFERIDYRVLRHYHQQLNQHPQPLPSAAKLAFCRDYLGVNNSLAMLACLLADNTGLDESQQRLGISRQTLRTYTQRLVKQCAARDKHHLLLQLKEGPLPWLQ